MKNILQERAYMALMMTMEEIPLPELEEIETEPRNQWHAQILAQANAMPTSVKVWDTQPDEPFKTNNQDGFDWPSNAI